jgi:hypothetical protein
METKAKTGGERIIRRRAELERVRRAVLTDTSQDENESPSIRLDCWPGGPKAIELLPDLIRGTGLVLDPLSPKDMAFGHWEWAIPAAQRELYLEVQDTIRERIQDLFNAGVIRFGSW